LLAAGVVLSGLCIAAGAPAQETEQSRLLSVLQRAVDAETTSGMRVGTAIVTPSVDVAETYDSNVFAASGNEHSDWFTSILPRLDILADWPRGSLALTAQGEFRDYSTFSRENIANGSVQGTGRFDLAPNAYVLAGGGYQLLHEDRGALVPVQGVSPTQFTVLSGKAGFVVEPAPMGIRLDATVDSYGYNSISLLNGTVIDERVRDHITYALAPRVSYQIVPQYNAFLQAVVNRRQYNSGRAPDGIDRSSTGYSVDLGTSFNLTSFAAGEAYLGYIDQNYGGRVGSAVSAFDFGGKLEWKPAPDTSVRLNVSRSVEESALLGSPGYLQTAVRLGIEHALMPRFLVLGSLGYANADFARNGGNSDFYDVRLGARYALSTNFTAGLEYDFGHRSSTAPLPSYTRHVVELRLHGQL